MRTYEDRFQALSKEGKTPIQAAYKLGYLDGLEPGYVYAPPIISTERAAYVKGLELGRHDKTACKSRPSTN